MSLSDALYVAVEWTGITNFRREQSPKRPARTRRHHSFSANMKWGVTTSLAAKPPALRTALLATRRRPRTAAARHCRILLLHSSFEVLAHRPRRGLTLPQLVHVHPAMPRASRWHPGLAPALQRKQEARPGRGPAAAGNPRPATDDGFPACFVCSLLYGPFLYRVPRSFNSPPAQRDRRGRGCASPHHLSLICQSCGPRLLPDQNPHEVQEGC